MTPEKPGTEDIAMKNAQQEEQEREAVLPLRIEGTREEVAEEIARISPDGSPGDANVGPGLIAVEVGLAVLFFGLVAVGVGWLMGWVAGVGAFAIAMAALLINPSAIAAVLRIKERRTIAERHRRKTEHRAKTVRAADFEPR